MQKKALMGLFFELELIRFKHVLSAPAATQQAAKDAADNFTANG